MDGFRRLKSHVLRYLKVTWWVIRKKTINTNWPLIFKQPGLMMSFNFNLYWCDLKRACYDLWICFFILSFISLSPISHIHTHTHKLFCMPKIKRLICSLNTIQAWTQQIHYCHHLYKSGAVQNLNWNVHGWR